MSEELTQTELNEIKTKFLNKRAEIIKSLKQKDSDLDLDTHGDSVDHIQGELIADITKKLSSREIMLLNKIDLSLQKISEGEFGDCENCGEPIGFKRLAALPGCDMCVACAERKEKLG